MAEFVIEGVNYSYNHDMLLSNVYLRVNTGVVFGLFGRNGSGKTTLFNCLSGCYSGAVGMLKVDNLLIDSKNRWQYFGYLNQNNFLPFDIKVKNAVKMILDRDIHDERVEKLSEVKVGKLSGGEIRYIETLIILELNRPFILLDEPFSEIEPRYIKKLGELIKKKSECSGIIITDHNHHAVREICNQAGILKDRGIFRIENTDEELRRYGYFTEK